VALARIIRLGLLQAGCVAGSLQPAVAQSLPVELRTTASPGISFVGLRRVPQATALLTANLPRTSAPTAAQLRAVVARLDQTGWFASIRVLQDARGLTFAFEEYPLVSSVTFSGSSLLTSERVQQLLDDGGAQPAISRPMDTRRLQTAVRMLLRALGELGHPFAQIDVRERATSSGAVAITFAIRDGPHVPVRDVTFAGASTFSPRTLRKQMKQIRPGAWLPGLRHKNGFTAEQMAADAGQLAAYYRAHGFASVKIAAPRVEEVSVTAWRWWPWPRRTVERRLRLTVPIAEGPRLLWTSFAVYDCFANVRDDLLLRHSAEQIPAPYSAMHTREIAADLAPRLPCGNQGAEMQAQPRIDPIARTVHVTFRAVPSDALTIRRISFAGHHRFPERFYRRRLGIHEGQRWVPEEFHAGLAAIARDGYVKPVAAENIQLKFDRAASAVDIHVRVEEAGRQRISLVGGISTAGLAYNLFNALGGDELLTGHLEGGPPSMRIALGLAKDGLLGNRAALGLSLLHTVMRPRLPGRRHERLFRASSTAVEESFAYDLTPQQRVNVAYQFASTRLEVPATTTASGLPSANHFSSSQASASWLRATSTGQVQALAAASGGPLGGAQDLLRYASSAVRHSGAARSRAAWAARVQSAGVFAAPWANGSLPPAHALLYPGEEWVRGVRPGEFASRAGLLRGLHLVHGANLEQTVTLLPRRLSVAAFSDGAAGWRLADGGPDSPRYWRAAVGLELRWQIPQVPGRWMPLGGETIRISSAFAPWLRRGGRRTALGWALGALF